MTKQRIKANGIHYTPSDLAGFLAEVTARQLDGLPGVLRVLDDTLHLPPFFITTAGQVHTRHL